MKNVLTPCCVHDIKRNTTNYVCKFLIFVGFFVILFPQILSAQIDNKGFQKPVFPSSPNAAALGKYGDIPVSTYTGLPSISVPLGELKGKFLSLPISLSYHASGVKVDEVASSVGLSWALNSGGVITRTIHGTPDEGPNGYATYDFDINNYQQLYDIANGTRDTETDLFFFNISGYSGKFFLDRVNGVIVPRLVDFQDIKIEMLPASGNNPIAWKMTAPDGTIYTFATPEYTNAPNELDGLDNKNVTAWYVSRIETLPVIL